jgi:amino acid permease
MASENDFEKGALRAEALTFWEAVCIIVGANIGAGILSLAFGTKNAGWPVLVIWLIVAGVFTTVSMMYVAETTLRTKKPLQLSGLAETYLGQFGSWAIFASVAINSIGCLIAYTSGSGKILSSMLGIAPTVGSLLFFIPATVVIWYGLRVTGVAEKFITFGMTALVLILIVASVVGPGLKAEYLSYADWYYAVPVFNLAIFCFVAQYAVPELTRGFAGGDIRLLPKAIKAGMLITGILLALVPMSALGMSGPKEVSEVATIAWGRALGQWAFFTANGFALCAMLTSFWAVGETFLTNIVDRLKFPSEWNIKYRLFALALVVVPPFYLAYSGLVGFVGAIYFAGSFAGVVMSIIPVMMLRAARRHGDREPEWTCGAAAHPAVQTLLIVLFCGGALYAIFDFLKLLPHGW